MEVVLTKKQIEDYRRRKWSGRHRSSLRTLGQMARFLDEVGMCLIFGSRDIPLPKIYDCASGDSDWWAWKDLLQAKKLAYNGRIVRHKATLISMELLPAFLAIYLTGGGYTIHEEEYYWGKLGQLANKVAEYLDREGPTPVDVLRRATVPEGKEHTRRFHAALFELQSKFKTVSVGLVDRGWGVRVLGLFADWVPAEVERAAESMGREEALQRVAEAFLETAGALREAMLPRIFGWSSAEASRLADSLVSDGVLRRGRIRGDREPWIAASTL